MEESGNQIEGTGVPPPAPKTSGMATAALILAILGLCTCITAPIGLVLGIIALAQTNRDPQLQGRGMAIAGMIIGGLITLVALIALVVAFLIGGISVPAFVRAREAAIQTNCMSNVKQLGMAMQMYASDYDAHFPAADKWNESLQPYYKNRKVLVCRSDKTGGPSYGMNDLISSLSQADVASPPQVVSFFDSMPGRNKADGEMLLPSPPRHPDGNNVGFVDGHATSVSDPETLNWDPKATPSTEVKPSAPGT